MKILWLKNTVTKIRHSQEEFNKSFEPEEKRISTTEE